MPVIGTAGHVDHGKTALIAALTGIDTDRLPEEKARGMTTDLGFAHFSDPLYGPIGVLDVPGHERFIRNMAAGAAGIDGALLVVAADDGWMEQTGRHLDILKALRIPVLTVALTKADLAGETDKAALALDLARRLRAEYEGLEVSSRGPAVASLLARSFWPRVIPVVAPRGEGIPELRSAVLEALALIPPARCSCGANIWIDRVFETKGAGMVLTGSLRGGSLEIGQMLSLLPGGESVRIRGLQCYGEPRKRLEPGQRAAIALSSPRDKPRRGSRLLGLSESRRGTQGGPKNEERLSAFALRIRTELAQAFYMKLSPESSSWKPRPGTEHDIAAGTTYSKARFWIARAPGFVRVFLEEGLPLVPGDRIIVLRAGGADMLASGDYVIRAESSAKGRAALESALFGLDSCPGIAVQDMPLAIEALRTGAVEHQGLGELPGLRRAGDWLWRPSALEEARTRLLSLLADSGRLAASELDGRLGLPPGAGSAVAESLAAEGLLRRDGALLASREPANKALSGAEVSLLDRLEAAYPLGLDLDADGRPGDGRLLDALCKSGLAVGLGDRLYFGAKAYERHRAAILGSRPKGSRFALSEAKDATSLSRKWTIPLLNRLERDGFVKRDGESRIVL